MKPYIERLVRDPDALVQRPPTWHLTWMPFGVISPAQARRIARGKEERTLTWSDHGISPS